MSFSPITPRIEQYHTPIQPIHGTKNVESCETAILKNIQKTASQHLKFIPIKTLEDVDPRILKGALKVYQTAFSKAPYCECFSEANVKAALQDVLDRNGDLIFGVEVKKTVSLAGGYQLAGGTYFIEELAVSPKKQGKGYGRSTFNHLLQVIKQQNPLRQEIRTTSKNTPALKLYESSGFVRELGLETVPQVRQNGKIELDERVYLSKPMLSDEERLMTLKHVAIAYPCGNVTAVIFDKLLEIDRKLLNQRIMDSWKSNHPDQPEIEQCCFITTSHHPEAMARIEMLGGEFCGNATRSSIWLITKGIDYQGLIEVSGVSRPLEFLVKDGEVILEMPLPEKGHLVEDVEEGSLVHLDGISHLVVTADKELAEPRELLELLLKTNKYDCASSPAFGVSYFDQRTGAAKFCVWVKAVDTIFDESACGSGTCAIAIAKTSENKQSQELEILQPSGKTIRAVTELNGASGVAKAFIAGKVDVLHDGEFTLK